MGNDGYYYDSPEKCEEYLSGNLRLAIESVIDLGADFNNIPLDEEEAVQYLDCMIRLHLLWECIWNALRDLGYEEDY